MVCATGLVYVQYTGFKMKTYDLTNKTQNSKIVTDNITLKMLSDKKITDSQYILVESIKVFQNDDNTEYTLKEYFFASDFTSGKLNAKTQVIDNPGGIARGKITRFNQKINPPIESDKPKNGKIQTNWHVFYTAKKVVCTLKLPENVKFSFTIDSTFNFQHSGIGYSNIAKMVLDVSSDVTVLDKMIETNQSGDIIDNDFHYQNMTSKALTTELAIADFQMMLATSNMTQYEIDKKANLPTAYSDFTARFMKSQSEKILPVKIGKSLKSDFLSNLKMPQIESKKA